MLLKIVHCIQLTVLGKASPKKTDCGRNDGHQSILVLVLSFCRSSKARAPIQQWIGIQFQRFEKSEPRPFSFTPINQKIIQVCEGMRVERRKGKETQKPFPPFYMKIKWSPGTLSLLIQVHYLQSLPSSPTTSKRTISCYTPFISVN